MSITITLDEMTMLAWGLAGLVAIGLGLWLLKDKAPCRHPAAALHAINGRVEEDGGDADFIGHRMRYECLNCRKEVSISWSSLRGGVEAFIARGHTRG